MTAWIQCPGDVAERFKERLANEMHAAFHCQRGVMHSHPHEECFTTTFLIVAIQPSSAEVTPGTFPDPVNCSTTMKRFRYFHRVWERREDTAETQPSDTGLVRKDLGRGILDYVGERVASVRQEAHDELARDLLSISRRV